MRTREKNTRIYLVRHGQTDYSVDRIYCDSEIDPPLNEAGQAQAEAMSEYFRDRQIAALFASPAQRTRTTAEKIASVSGLEIDCSEALRERRFGIWEGMYFNQIAEQYPDEYLKWKQDPVDYTPEQGETLEMLSTRLSGFLKPIVDAFREKEVVVVTHVGPIRSLVTSAFEMPKSQFRQIKIDYAGITTIDYGESKNNLINLNIVRY